ncbi:MAG: peroxiredoxin family protein [Planctomycetales bacterium]|nr:peroxiredoxin family protein [Planctomycetales bacterium]
MPASKCVSLGVVCAAMLIAATARSHEASLPTIGKPVPDFTLKGIAGSLSGEVNLKETLAKGPIVLVVLRGFPGYQCPLCTRQVAALAKHADDFKQAGANVLMVYPGEAKQLAMRANEFLKDLQLPEPLTLLLDPDYEFTNDYHLRWDAPKETAYPSTFVMDRSGIVRMAVVSKTHGGRSEVADVLEAVQALGK